MEWTWGVPGTNAVLKKREMYNKRKNNNVWQEEKKEQKFMSKSSSLEA